MVYFIQIGLNSLMEAMQVALVAAAFLLVHSVTRTVNMGLGAAFLVGGYAYYSGMQWFGTIGAAFLVAMLALGLFSVLNLALLRPFVAKGLDLMALIVGVSLWFIFQEGISLVYGAQGRFLVEGVLPTLHLGPWVMPITGVITVGVSVFLAILGTVLFLKTPLGRSLRALKQHSAAMAQLGVKEKRLQAGAFLVAISLVGLMGILSGMNQAITPSYSLHTLASAFLAFLVGGGKDIRGVLIAALLLGLMPHFLLAASGVSQSWREVLVFAIAAILLLFRPDGILSIKTRLS